jgi:hypothetical protein
MHLKRRIAATAAIAALLVVGAEVPVDAHQRVPAPVVTTLTTFEQPHLGSGSTIGPDGALYVTDGDAGMVWRIDPRTGAKTEFAHGLPLQQLGIGGAMDIAFLGHTAYVLVTMVGGHLLPAGTPFGNSTNGIYRLESNGTFTLIADIGTWAAANPPPTDYFITTGVQYAMQPYLGGFLVTDGHHNRLLRVTLDGHISVMTQFGDIVPTGLEAIGPVAFMAEAGPVPHQPQDAKVVALTPYTNPVTIASGRGSTGPGLTVDVERGPGFGLYVLLQGVWDLGPDPSNAGKPAKAGTGVLAKVEWNGTLTPIVDGLDRPTSLEFIDDSAFVVGLDGTVTRIDHVSAGSH